jgi:hypothetical protein
MITYVAVGGRTNSRAHKAPETSMLTMKSARLPIRTETVVDKATPRSNEASPKPLNQEKRFTLPTTYLKYGSITLPRTRMAVK